MQFAQNVKNKSVIGMRMIGLHGERLIQATFKTFFDIFTK